MCRMQACPRQSDSIASRRRRCSGACRSQRQGGSLARNRAVLLIDSCPAPGRDLITTIQALGPTVVALAAALVAALIAYRQWRTARDKLKLDLFERRHIVYDAAHEFLILAANESTLETSAVFEYASKISQAKWLFDTEYYNYLNAFKLESLRYRTLSDQLLDPPAAHAPEVDRRAHQQAIKEYSALRQWFHDQITILDERSYKYLKLTH